MKLLKQDMYINCDDLKEEANELYKELIKRQIKIKEINVYYYIQDMNKYLNNNNLFKEHQIKNYIDDLKLILCF